MNQQTKVILRTITTILVCLAMLLAFMISGIRLLGFQIFGVLTGSMEPAYPTGSLIYVKETDPSELKVRDVITFNMSGVTVTHRIIEIVPDENNPSVLRYRTKGDANDDPDQGLVDPYNIVGKVMFCVPKMGYFSQYIQSPPGLYIAIGASILLIIFVFVTDDMDSKPASKGKRKGSKKTLPHKKGSASAARTSRTEDTPRRSRGFVPGEEEMSYTSSRQAQPARPPQQGYPQQQAYRQPQQGYPQQQAYRQQQGYPQQQAYRQPQQGYPQQQAYRQPQQGYPQQQAYRPPQQGYPQQQAYRQPQQGYPPQQAYRQPQQGYPQGYGQQTYSQNSGYAPQGTRRRTAQPENINKEMKES